MARGNLQVWAHFALCALEQKLFPQPAVAASSPVGSPKVKSKEGSIPDSTGQASTGSLEEVGSLAFESSRSDGTARLARSICTFAKGSGCDEACAAAGTQTTMRRKNSIEAFLMASPLVTKRF